MNCNPHWSSQIYSRKIRKLGTEEAEGMNHLVATVRVENVFFQMLPEANDTHYNNINNIRKNILFILCKILYRFFSNYNLFVQSSNSHFDPLTIYIHIHI